MNYNMFDEIDYFTFTTNRDWMTKSTAAIAFSPIGVNNAGLAAFFDNVKVYEITGSDVMTYSEKTTFNNAIVTSIEVEYYDGRIEELTTDKIIGEDAKRIAVNFSMPLADKLSSEVTQPINYSVTEGGAKFSGVYSVIEDVINLRRVHTSSDNNASNVAFTGKLSDDKKTYYIELDDDLFDSGKDYVLNVSSNVSFENSTYSQLENPQRIQFSVDDRSGLSLKDFSLLYEAGNVWVPLTKTELITPEMVVKLKIDGINLSEDKQNLFFGYAQYGNDDGVDTMTNLVIDTITVDGTSPIEVDNTVTVDTEKAIDIFKAFIWEKDTMRPLVANESIR